MITRLPALIIFCLAILFSPKLMAAERTLLIGVGLSKPPYIIQEEDAGAEFEIVERALEISGYKMIPRYMPMKRIPHELNGGSLDGGMTLRAHVPIDGFFSNDIISYQNYAITLKNKSLELNDLNDLGKYRVTAFQNASKLLGGDFKNAIVQNKEYAEVANQALQVKMLAAGRTDIVVSDFRIFLHFKKQVEKETGHKIEVNFHPLFPPTPYRVGFRDRMVRDDFDEAIEHMRRSGEHQAILEKYISAEDLKAIY